MTRHSQKFRAQGTIEYLIILAVILIISLFTVGLFTDNFGGKTANVSVSSNKISEKITSGGVSVLESAISDDGNGLIRLQNNSGESLSITKITTVNSDNSKVDVNYNNKYVAQGSDLTFSLNNVASSCQCVAGDATRTCNFEITLTSASGLTKTERLTVVVDCVSVASAVDENRVVDPLINSVAWTQNAGITFPGGYCAGSYVQTELADFNNDGVIDLVCSTDSIVFPWFYVNNGTNANPNWVEDANWRTYDVSTTTPHQKITMGDLDGDNQLDLLVSGYDQAYNVLAYKNNGSGSNPRWTKMVAWEVPNYRADRSYKKPTLVDIDGDGLLDVFVAGRAPDTWGDYNWAWGYQNTGTSSSPAWTRRLDWDINTMRPITGYIYYTLSFIDIDSDGDLDVLAAGGSTGGIYGYKNIGTMFSPIWQRAATWDLSATLLPYAFISAGDITGDSKKDIIAGRWGSANPIVAYEWNYS